MINHIIDHQMVYKNRTLPTVRFYRVDETSLFESLRENLRDVFFPEKQAPLRVTSRPVPVRSIWEKRNTRRAATGSLMVHVAMIAGVIALVAYQPKVALVEPIKEK